MWIKLLILTAMMSLMQGCHGTIAPPIDTGCMSFRLIDTNAADRKVVPKAVKLQIAQHNEAWDRKCGVLK